MVCHWSYSFGCCQPEATELEEKGLVARKGLFLRWYAQRSKAAQQDASFMSTTSSMIQTFAKYYSQLGDRHSDVFFAVKSTTHMNTESFSMTEAASVNGQSYSRWTRYLYSNVQFLVSFAEV